MTTKRKKEDNTMKVPTSILLTVLLLFFGIAFFRTAFNLSKVITEERAWIGLSDEKRREKAYGPLYQFTQHIKTLTVKDTRVFFITTDPRAHYLVKYFLYPRKVEVVKAYTDTIRASYAAVFLSNCGKEFEIAIKNLEKDFPKQIYKDTKSCQAIYRKN